MPDQKEPERFTPTPVPFPADIDPRYDVTDEMRVAIVHRFVDDWRLEPDLSAERRLHLAMFAAASVRALFYEMGVLRRMEERGSE